MNNPASRTVSSGIRLCTYNILMGKALEQAGEIAHDNSVDVLCLQETQPGAVPEELGGLALATSCALSSSVGLALYYSPDRLALDLTQDCALPYAWYEKYGTHSGLRLQLARFTISEGKNPFVVGNFHLANLYASNAARRKQFSSALTATDQFRADVPAVIAGDTNYPFREAGLLRLAEQSAFLEVGAHMPGKTHTSRLVDKKFDRIFATASGVTEAGYGILPFGASDHAPIIADLSFEL